ncbi:hypothetical protein EG68_01252 [Paragonimus skrjabini miyazakii]|uniref:receptor protein serine/threonine kinase n=1 Tax=Paragonimus skrjabini miyazakii TaxID=59628 RepID=A0A8S9Z7F1_9TREM|nr:hypothetical protein EG68_01252 [Paragonimus skrjabini miyazakii]
MFHNSPELLDNSRGADDKPLNCLCNDHNNCLFSSSRQLLENGLNSSLQKLGHCVTTSKGRCYTVKYVNLPPSTTSYSAVRRLRRTQSFDVDRANYSTFSNLKSENKMVHSNEQSSNSLTEYSNVDRFIRVRYGCLSSYPEATLSCNGHFVNHSIPRAIACCNSSDFCNAKLVPDFFHHSTHLDAYKVAVRNQRLLDKNLARDNRQRINSKLNIGPNLLRGEKVIYDAPLNNDQLKYLAFKPTSFYNLVFIVAFSVVAFILLLTVIGVYLYYKRRLRKDQLKAYGSVLWYPSPHYRQRNSRKNTTVSVNNTFISGLKLKSKNNVDTIKYPTGISGSTSQTTSTNLTRAAESPGDTTVIHNSKSNCTHLLQWTIGRQVSLQEFLGRGRFSDVWTGTWRGEPVVAKIFHPQNRLAQCIWRRTASAHRCLLLRHRTVQSIMAADWVHYPQETHQTVLNALSIQSGLSSPVPCTMLIGELHQWGTLKDLMGQYRWRSYCVKTENGNALSTNDVKRVHTLSRNNDTQSGPILTSTDGLMFRIIMRMALSITQGLCFLHSELAGTRGKVALAHRDLKPSNIYVRSDWTCCIGDIGLAVCATPCPLPLPLDELHSLYNQYLAQVNSENLVPNDRLFSPYGQAPVMAQTEYGSRLCNSSAGPIGSQNRACTADKLTVDRAELLDWWPVGGMQIGSPRYMSPELLEQSVGPFCFETLQKADIYALGLVLWELISWAVPQISDSDCNCPDDDEYQIRHSARSSTDSVCVSNSSSVANCGLHIKGPHRPAYQLEWEMWGSQLGCKNVSSVNEAVDHGCEGTQSSGDSESWIPLLMKKTEKSKSSCTTPSATYSKYSGEPDVRTMHYLVCVLGVRPKLPTPSRRCLSSHEQLFSRYHLVTPLYDLSVTHTYSGNMPTILHDPNCVGQVQSADTEIPDKPLESSSSGASSLKEVHTGDAGTHGTETTSSSIYSILLGRTLINQFAALLSECWSANPESRLTALRIRKTLERISDDVDTCLRTTHIQSEFSSARTTNFLGDSPAVPPFAAHQQMHSGSSTIKATN